MQVNQSLIFPLKGVLVLSGPLTTSLPKQGDSLNSTYTFVLQILLILMATLPIRSYFLYGTKKNCIHLRALSKHHNMQFTSIWCMVQHLDMPGTFTFRTMLTASVIHSPILEPTRHQKNHKIQSQSCLVHRTSLLMTGRCFTSVKIPVHQQPCHQTLFP